MSISKGVNNDLNDLKLNIRLSDISTRANTKPENRVIKFTSPITNEMIDEYKKEFNKPYEVDGMKLKYMPSSQRIDYLDPEIPLDVFKTQRKNIEDAKKLSIENLNELNTYKEEYLKQISLMKEIINNSLNELEIEEASRNLDDLTQNLEKLNMTISDEEGKILNADFNLEKIKDDTSFIQAQNDKIRKDNQEKLRLYEEDFKLLNRGKLSIDKQPNESDEEFLQRLNDLAYTLYSDQETLFNAEIEAIRKFKNNLREVIKNETKIEGIAKSYTPQQLFELNKYWTKIKDKWIKNFGLNNTTIDVPDILNFINKLNIPNLDEENPAESLGENQQNSLFVEPASQEYSQEYNPISFELIDQGILYIRNRLNEKKLFVVISSKRIAVSTSRPDENHYIAINFKSPNDINKGFNTIFYDYLFENTENYDFTLSDKQLFLSEYFHPNFSKDQLIEHLRKKGVSNKNIKKKFIKTEFMNSSVQEEIIGYGIKPKQLPKYSQFGKVKILLDKLYHKNILSIKNNKNHNIQEFPNIEVSDEFVNLIMKIFDGEKIAYKHLENLNKNEKELFKLLMYISGLHKDKISDDFINLKSIEEKLKEKFQLLEGEILAGNNNPLLLKDMKETLNKMVSINLISLKNATDYYKNISNI